MSSNQDRRPAASRMEKQVRNLGRGLFWLSSTLLVVCVAMTGMYGFSLGTDPVNGALLALGFGATDIAGGLIASFCGACFAMQAKKVGFAAFLCALVCFAFSFYGVVGFQSSNRESQAQAREKASNISDEFVTWSKTQIASAAAKANGKAQAELLAGGISTAGEQVSNQIKMIQRGGLPAADGTSTTFARVFRVDEKTARSYGISGGSAILLIVQYFCLWAYGFARHSLEPTAAAQQAMSSGISRFSNGRGGKPEGSHSHAMARSDLTELLAGGFDVSARGSLSFLARRWGWPANTTGRWLRRQPDIEIGPPGTRSKRRAGVSADSGGFAGIPAVNGRVHA